MSERRSHRKGAAHAELAAAAGGRPRTRGECPPFRPCPWVSCRYHLSIDIQKRRVVQVRIDPDDWTEKTPTCALDVADAAATPRRGRGAYDATMRAGMTLDEVGEVMGGISRERVRQVEEAALAKLAAAGLDVRGVLDEERRTGLTPEPPGPELTPSEAHAGYLRMRASFVPPPIRTLSPDEAAAAVAELRAHPKAPRGITCPPTISPPPKPSRAPEDTATIQPAPQRSPCPATQTPPSSAPSTSGAWGATSTVTATPSSSAKTEPALSLTSPSSAQTGASTFARKATNTRPVTSLPPTPPPITSPTSSASTPDLAAHTSLLANLAELIMATAAGDAT